MRHGKRMYLLFLFCLLCLTGCAGAEESRASFPCSVVLEEGAGFRAESYTASLERGGDAVFQLKVEDGYGIVDIDYPDYALKESEAGGVTLTLRQVRYSTAVAITAERQGEPVAYLANGGLRLDGGDKGEPVVIRTPDTHLRWNTAIGIDLFQRAGYTLTGWNTAPDGSGTAVGLGSRIEPEEGLTLYAQWSPWTEASCFTWEPAGDGAAITGYTGTEETITVPAELGGLTVRRIQAEAFAGTDCDTVILPPTLRVLEDGAFQGAALTTLYLSDNIQTISDYVFQDCGNLTTLHLNAVEEPVYSGSYYSTFADKFDRLLSLQGERKLVLFSGSSTRFGYDSARLDEAFSDYQVVNMGVFAYTNAVPQLLLILDCMGEGDILLHAPEFDAAQRQFCTTDKLDAPFFSLMEANYDLIARLDLRQLEQVFSALSSYLTAREGMEARGYARTALDYDEDGNPVDTPSYNAYGDYILYRPNAETEAPVYGLPVEYTVSAYPRETFVEPLNEMYARFLERGVRVYFTYAPRNRLAISEESTPEARAELDEYFRGNLIVPVISSLEDSLWSGVYLYGTDNHLSTEGAALRTERIIDDIQAQLAREEGTP